MVQTTMRYTDPQIRDLLSNAKQAPSETLEDETIEFKGYRSESSLHNAKDLPEEISALANRSGGLILVGVQDSSNVRHGDWEAQLAGVDRSASDSAAKYNRPSIFESAQLPSKANTTW